MSLLSSCPTDSGDLWKYCYFKNCDGTDKTTEELKRDLREFVEVENYEAAAIIRDELKNREG